MSPCQLRRVAALPALSSSAATPRGPWRWFPNPPASGLPGGPGELAGQRAQALALVAPRLAEPAPWALGRALARVPIAQPLAGPAPRAQALVPEPPQPALAADRKSTRLNSSHLGISY